MLFGNLLERTAASLRTEKPRASTHAHNSPCTLILSMGRAATSETVEIESTPNGRMSAAALAFRAKPFR